MSHRNTLFRLATTVPVTGALYHLGAMAIPAFGAWAYPPDYSVQRHIVFILIDVALTYLLLRGPIWLIWPYSLLTLQVLNGHGQAAWRSFRGSGPIDWVSIATVIGTLLLFVLLLFDWRDRRSRLSG